MIRPLLAALLLGALPAGALAEGESTSADSPYTVLVTGSNRGLGLEFVRQYAERGWRVIATARDPEAADELNALAAAHGNVTVERLDVLDHAGIDALAARYAGQPVDVLVNNAGLMRGPDRGQTVGSIDYDEFELFYRVNAMGPLKVSEAFHPHVSASRLKVMAALTTGQGQRGIPVPGFTLYKTSKSAMDALQREMALRWRRDGIKVVTLLPGRVLTHGEPPAPGQQAVPIADSISGMIQVIATLTPEQSGQTINWDGERIE